MPCSLGCKRHDSTFGSIHAAMISSGIVPADDPISAGVTLLCESASQYQGGRRAEMAAKHNRAMPAWAYAVMALLAILLFAVALYLKEHARRDGDRSRVADAQQQHSNWSDSHGQCNANAIIHSDS